MILLRMDKVAVILILCAFAVYPATSVHVQHVGKHSISKILNEVLYKKTPIYVYLADDRQSPKNNYNSEEFYNNNDYQDDRRRNDYDRNEFFDIKDVTKKKMTELKNQILNLKLLEMANRMSDK
ncbi:hypothetical protein B5X24_HaOG214899 [Helicoverpa armigera]|uniref:Uncharacterized protein n=1 Tax=Helicoverpa armigera TaxID=29058 RepID=A0A2W1BD05_HELAM|nr:hypothetical protein B5X24_HaOG214899 [Helicoverpa armigera]